MGRRSTGELEKSIQRYLWAIDEPATPADVHGAVAPELAYTTIMTVLTRLHEKKLVERERRGRSFVYWPASEEADHRAVQMHQHLDSAANRFDVLSSFVDTLDEAEMEKLRHLLAED